MESDVEISRALALAIGWPFVTLENGICEVRDGADYFLWSCFDHREWNVAGPIAERYNKFPYMHRDNDGLPDGKWVVWPNTIADTPQTAIAMAVINGAEG